jgi:uncharacterized DUF497 family protein
MDELEFEFDTAKNEWLIQNRGIGFESVIARIAGGGLLRILEHPDPDRYPGQVLYEVDVNGYVHIVPVVRRGRTLVLKTIYPSRKATRRLRGGKEPAQ